MANYPTKRLRRLRYNPKVRDLVRETVLTKNDLIYPLFVVPGENIKNEVKSMPGVYQMSIDIAVKECKEVEEMGIPAVILFGIPEHKDEVGSDAYNEHGIIQRAIRAIRTTSRYARRCPCPLPRPPRPQSGAPVPGCARDHSA